MFAIRFGCDYVVSYENVPMWKDGAADIRC